MLLYLFCGGVALPLASRAGGPSLRKVAVVASSRGIVGGVAQLVGVDMGTDTDVRGDAQKKKKKVKNSDEAKSRKDVEEDEDAVIEQDVGEQRKKKSKKRARDDERDEENEDMHDVDTGEKKKKKKKDKKKMKQKTEDTEGEVEGEVEGEENDEKPSKKKKKKKEKKKRHISDEDEITPKSTSKKHKGGSDKAIANTDQPDDPPTVQHPWTVPEADHAETPQLAYEHIEPLLASLAKRLGKDKSELKIYDPYFCTGAIVRNMREIGFTNVYNKCEDFYQVPPRHFGRCCGWCWC